MSKNPVKVTTGASAHRASIGRTVSARIEEHAAIKRAKTDQAQIYTFPDFLTDDECDQLVALIDAVARPSTLLSDNGDPEFRTSSSSDLNRDHGIVGQIDNRIADLLGIPRENAETMQGQRYAPNQQFRAHCDYFQEGAVYWDRMVELGGQRTWTAMIYLNDVDEGGATWFPRAGVRFKPKKRLMVIWNNMLPDGNPNFDTLHEGTRVVTGQKYIITKWFRENAWIRGHIPTYAGSKVQ